VWLTAGFLAVGGVQRAWAQEAGDVGPKVGDKAPLIELEGLLQAPKGASTKPEALRGKVVVLEFWATWCGPCIVHFPHLNELADRFKGKPVQFIFITEESREVVERFLKKREIKSWVGLDTDRSVFRALRVAGIPQTVIIDTEGRIAALTSPEQVTEQVLRDLLAGKTVALTDLHAAARKASSIEDSKGEPLLEIVIKAKLGGFAYTMSQGRIVGEGVALQSYIAAAYGVPYERVVGSAVINRLYDVVFSIPPSQHKLLQPLLQSALEAALGISTRREMRESDAYALRKIAGAEPKIRKSPTEGGGHSSHVSEVIVAVNFGIQGLADSLQSRLGKPVVNETGLDGRYDWDIQYDEGNHPRSLIQAVRDQLGLELIKTRLPVEFLVVEQSVGDAEKPVVDGARPSEPESLPQAPNGASTKPEPLLKITIHPADPPDQFGGWSMNPGRYKGKGVALQSLIATAYRVTDDRVVGSALPGGGTTSLERRYDVVVSIPPSRRELLPALLQSTLQAAFGISTRRETREADAFALRRIAETEPKIRKAAGGQTTPLAGGAHASYAGGVIVAVNWNIQGLVDTLQDMLGMPVVDQTALEGIYDWDIQYDEGNPTSLIQAVRDQLGLELIKTKLPVEFLVVEESVGDQGQPPSE